MTKNPEILPRLVLFTAFSKVGLLDITGPQSVFWFASEALGRRGLAGYVIHIASLSGGLVETAEGAILHTARLADFDESAIDTLVVPGSPHIESVLEISGPISEWLRSTAGQVRRTASVCTGTFLLAQAGLLDDKHAATHWGACHTLKDRFPTIKIDRDALFVADGAIWTSAGVSAGIDLALALVEADHGREIALEVAKEMVVFLKRPGGQTQFSTLVQLQGEGGGAFDELHLWISGNIKEINLPVELLAEKARMSPRNFARVYKQKTGRTPAKAVELFRLEAARRRLEDTDDTSDQIATRCGFGDGERMRASFQRHLKVSPREYRRRFSR